MFFEGRNIQTGTFLPITDFVIVTVLKENVFMPKIWMAVRVEQHSK